MQKKTLLTIAFVLSLLLLSPFIMFYGLYVIKLLIFPFAVLFYFFEYVFISFFISIIIFIGSLLFLKNINKNILLKIFLSIFITFIFATISGLYEAEVYINNKSIDKFGKEPEYVSICLKSTLQFCPFRCDNICYYPHALIEKNGKYYYWSFQEKAFFELPEGISRNIPYWQI